ncbi:undecaprenyl-phosphate glucose phosphotransferase [Clostridioides sp. ES-S-0123-01]|uniref:undecaprenyl-phosphate glucose phosphotransferase n=1 Tax=Clostridioides sp. ES-S-0123-01 TaxID=2770783 RepID=UPI001D104F8D|nr:undecaprenyl-phosphate glucose phosphotransferase [Clostridioides sp. ES-S-0123-01]
MIKENQKILNKVQIGIDIIVILISFILAYFTKFDVLKGTNSIGNHSYIITTFCSVLIYFILYNVLDLYSTKRTCNIYKEITTIINANIIGALILILILFIIKLINYSRMVLVFFIIYNIIFMSLSRIILRYILHKYRSKGFNQKHCLIVGATDIGKKLTTKIRKNHQWGYNIVGYLDDKINTSDIFENLLVLGTLDEIEIILKKIYIDIVFITVDLDEFHKVGEVINQCEKAGVRTNIIPYYYEYVSSKPYMDYLDDIPIIDTRRIPLDNYINNTFKRIFDILFSLFAIFITLPIMLFSVIMIWFTSPGEVIYKQIRVGLNRKNFNMYKFRSMKVQKEEDEKLEWTTKGDLRKTKWGAIMRKVSIDELPQFFNVLKGDMSIVGPRPERPFFVDKFKDEVPRYMVKHQVRPGITGWAQINGYRGDTSIEKRIEHDLYYIENWTFLFDIKIIFLTLFKGIINKNAY